MVKKLSRDSIQRMVRGGGNTGYSTGGAGGGVVGISMGDVWSAMAGGTDEQINGSHLTDALTGYATQNWVGQNYLSIAFFSQLFKVYKPGESAGDPDVEVTPNTIDQDITNIKAMFGFWTEFYISALGTGGQSTVGLRLSQLADVNVAGVQNDQVLKYDATSQKWVPGAASSGTDMATVWANLAANGNQQINYSHLSGAVSLSQGTITIGSASITPLTQSTGDDRYLKLTGGTISGFLSVNYTSSSETRYTGIEVTSPASESSIGFGIDNSGRVVFGRYTNRGFVWSTNGGEVMSFLDGGNIGIGTNNPSYKLHVDGTLGVTGLSSFGSSLRVWASGNSWNEGIRIHAASNGWSGVVFCETSNSSDSGTSANTWSIHNHEGVFGMYKSGSDTSASSFMTCSGSEWSFSTGIYTAGYVTALSDARHKNVIGDTGLTVKDIAEAPAIRFTWKDRDDQSVFAGSIAQYWQKVLPEVVQSQADGTLSLDYQVTALMAAIVTARKVENHETRLRRLEKMFALNENDLEE